MMAILFTSYMPVEKPLVERCRNGKDFGRGFYVTTSEDQAKAFTSSSVKKAITEGKVSALHDHGVVSVYRYHENPVSRFYIMFRVC